MAGYSGGCGRGCDRRIPSPVRAALAEATYVACVPHQNSCVRLPEITTLFAEVAQRGSVCIVTGTVWVHYLNEYIFPILHVSHPGFPHHFRNFLREPPGPALLRQALISHMLSPCNVWLLLPHPGGSNLYYSTYLN